MLISVREFVQKGIAQVARFRRGLASSENGGFSDKVVGGMAGR